MTIMYAVIVLGILFVLLMTWCFQRTRSHHAPEVGDTKTDIAFELPQLSHLNFSFLTRIGASIKTRTLGETPADQIRSGEAPRSIEPLSQRQRSIHARLAMFSPGIIRRTTARRDCDKAPVGMPDGSESTARQLQRDEHFRRALELLPFAVLTTNRHGQIVLANAATSKLFGYAQRELIGNRADVFVPVLQTHFDAALPAGIAAARPVQTAGSARDVFARRKDGTEFPAEITANPLSSEADSDTLMVIVDRTDQYELLRNRQELTHLTRVSTLGELAGSLAHELNQPLTAILSNAQAAQRFLAAQPVNLAEVREILHDLVEDNRRASEVLRKIRALVKKGELEAAALSLASVVRDVALLVHSDAIVRGIRMYLKIAPELPFVYGDRVQLEQVILNLLLNAFEAMESRTAPDRAVTIEATLAGAGMIRVAVRDRGLGLAPDKLDRVFKPFVTSKREGLGLGLSITRSIVERHGGRIWAENNEDQGAVFYFTLPTGAAAERTRSRQQA
jgi:two-component system, LuxR family, sensor kinase FixL